MIAPPASAQTRPQLTRAFLFGNDALAELAPMTAFAPSADARAPSRQFRGVLDLVDHLIRNNHLVAVRAATMNDPVAHG